MSDDDDDAYQVGYGKPPKHTRFKKGQSGNPKGRPKGARSFKTDLEDILNAKVKVVKDGRPTTVTTQQAVLTRSIKDALDGKPRALDRALSMASEHSAEKEAQSAERTLSRADDEILARFLEDKLRASGPDAEQTDEEESDNGE